MRSLSAGDRTRTALGLNSGRCHRSMCSAMQRKKTDERTTPQKREPIRSSEMRCCRASLFPEHRRGSQWPKSCAESASNATSSEQGLGKTDPHCYWHRDYDICGKGYKRRGQRKEGVLLDSGDCCPSPSSFLSSSPPGKDPMLSDRVNASSESDGRRLRRV